jgi:hypothetical protein
MADPDTLAEAELPGDDRPWEKPGGVRRDCQPHRSGMLLFLATVSILCSLFSCLLLPGLIGLPLAISVSISARRDLGKMKAGLMDPGGEPQTLVARYYADLGTGLTLAFSIAIALFWLLKH